MGAFTLIKQIKTNGAMTFVGNTIGLSKEANTNNAGVEHSIGAFISTDDTLTYDNYATKDSTPPNNNSGVTLNINENGSFSKLKLIASSKIEYAYLIWGGSYRISNETPVDYTTSVTLTAVGATGSLVIDPSPTGLNLTPYLSNSTPAYYFYVYDVTTYISQLAPNTSSPAVDAKVSVENIPATIVPSTNNANAGGWTLCVMYTNGTLPSRQLTLFSGNETTFVSSGNTVSSTVSGFQTPTTGNVNGRILFTAIEGDAVLTGDSASITNKSNTAHDLFGPLNPFDNFFASQINNDEGYTDKSGSFGEYNQDPITNTNFSGCRQGWDITNVNANPSPFVNLDNNQTSTIVTCTSDNDRYWVSGVGIQLDENAPVLETSKTVDKLITSVGDVLTYTVTIKNTGTLPANDVHLDDDIPPFTAYVPGSATSNVSIDATNFPTKIEFDDPIVENSLPVTFTYKVKVTGTPPDRTIINFAEILYSYDSLEGIVTGFSQTNSVISSLLPPIYPVVPNYSANGCKNGSVTGQVVAIDTNHSDPPTFMIYDKPSHGFAKIDTNTGEWLYTPIVGFVGVDSFSVIVMDEGIASAQSFITINVLDVPCCELNGNGCCCRK